MLLYANNIIIMQTTGIALLSATMLIYRNLYEQASKNYTETKWAGNGKYKEKILRW